MCDRWRTSGEAGGGRVTAVLADGNVLIALTVPDHIHHRQAQRWLHGHDDRLATCPITQGTLLRFLLRKGIGTTSALAALDRIAALPQHTFWPDEISYTPRVLAGAIGHRQVTDSYLAALADHFGGSLVTLDKGLAALHHDTAVLIPT